MSEEREAASDPALAEPNAETKDLPRDKPEEPPLQKSLPKRGRSLSKEADLKTTRTRNKRHSEQERDEKLRLIEARVTAGSHSLKEAIKQAGVSEQTYYQWKRAAKAVDHGTGALPISGDGFEELVRLEEENQQLRQALATKLRSENAELRRRLGLH